MEHALDPSTPAVQGLHDVCPEAAWYWPDAQPEQILFAPGVADAVPGKQAVQVAEEIAWVALDHVPGTQFVHAEAPAREYTPPRQFEHVPDVV